MRAEAHLPVHTASELWLQDLDYMATFVKNGVLFSPSLSIAIDQQYIYIFASVQIIGGGGGGGGGTTYKPSSTLCEQLVRS